MGERFDPAGEAIVVTAVLVGPLRAVTLSLRLDTGASHTSVRAEFLRWAGYAPERTGRPRAMRSASGGGRGFALPVRHLSTLGVRREPFVVTAFDPPPAVVTDGLLGLDFFRGHVLTLDFARGRVSLRPPGRRWWPFGR